MKFIKILKKICCILYLITYSTQLSAVLSMSQYKPDSTFEEPYLTKDYFTTVTVNLSGGSAQYAYNNHKQRVAFLQQLGSEDLLERFIHPELPKTDTTLFAQGNLQGQFHVKELNIGFCKNMQYGFFMQGQSAIQDITVDTIQLQITSTNLTEQERIKVQTLQQKLPTSINRSGMFTTALFAGYHTSLVTFNHLDFIDIQIKTGIMSPQAMVEKGTELVQFPFMGNYNFGYPIVASSSAGCFDWLTFGLSGALIAYQPTLVTLPKITNATHNTILSDEYHRVKLHKGPLFTSNIYIKADHILQGISCTLGYCYTNNSKSSIFSPLQNAGELAPHALLNAWNLQSYYFQFDIDFACECNPNAPIISAYFNVPRAGKNCPKTNVWGGSCNLQVSYAF